MKELIERLKNDISYATENGFSMIERSWGHEEGCLISFDEAKRLIEAVENTCTENTVENAIAFIETLPHFKRATADRDVVRIFADDLVAYASTVRPAQAEVTRNQVEVFLSKFNLSEASQITIADWFCSAFIKNEAKWVSDDEIKARASYCVHLMESGEGYVHAHSYIYGAKWLRSIIFPNGEPSKTENE